MRRVAIVDLGYGNIGSVAVAFERLGVAVERTCDPAAIRAAPRVVLPGVGAAGYAMAAIARLGLGDVLRGLTQPLLGICLGMQLLFERSEEGGGDLLGILPGTVRKMTGTRAAPVPHMGWSRLAVSAPEQALGLSDGDYVYFAHSYVCPDGVHVAAAAEHGGSVPAVVARDTIWGVQFHPERSGAVGARVLEAFLRC